MQQIDRPHGVRPGQVFSLGQARNGGYTREQIRHRLRSGRWRRVVAQTYMDTTRELGPDERIRGALMTWPEAVVGFGVAAQWHDLPVPDPGPVQVYTSVGRHPTRDIVPTRASLAETAVLRRSGLSLTTRVQTIIDCLATLEWDGVERLLAWTMTRSLITHTDLLRGAAQRRGRPGVTQLDKVVELTRRGAVNRAEQRLHRVLLAAGMSSWVAGAAILDASGRRVAVVDVLFAAEKVVVELDGRTAHGDDAFQSDRTRHNALVVLGYTVLRFTWEDLRDRPSQVVTTVRAAVRRAATN